MPTPRAETSEQRIRAGAHRIRGEPAIAGNISQFLPRAQDRSRLVDGNRFLLSPLDSDRACLPSAGTFRTNQTTDGCGPWTSLDINGNCCVQSDLNFLSSVAAIMNGAAFHWSENRITREIWRWMVAVHPLVLPASNEIDVNLAQAGSSDALLKLAVNVRTAVFMHVGLSQPNQNFGTAHTYDLDELNGTVRLYPGSNGASVSFSSINHSISDFTNIRRLIVDCPIDLPAGTDASDVADIINGLRWTRYGTFQYELSLPPAIPVQSVGHELVNSMMFEGWVSTDDGVSRPSDGFSYGAASVTLTSEHNRIAGTAQGQPPP